MNEENQKLINRIKELEKINNDLLKEDSDEENKFRLLFINSLDPILIIDEYSFIECNKATCKILGCSKNDQIINTHPSKLSPDYQPDGELSELKAKRMMDIAYKKAYHRFEWVHIKKSGEEFWVDVALTRINYKGKEMLFTIWRDISKRKVYEKELINSEKRYSTLFEQAADGILVGIDNGEIVNANESILKLTQYKKEELIGKNIKILFDTHSLNSTPLRFDLVKKGKPIINERNIVTKNGEIIPIEMSTKLLEDGRMQALFRDISKRKKAEQDLKASEEKYKNIFHNVPLGVLHYDINGNITDCNDKFVEIIGSSREQLLGFNMFNEINNEKLKEVVKKSLKEKESYYEDWYLSVTGNKNSFVRAFFKAITNDMNEIVSGIGLIEDITERKLTELQIKENKLFIEQITEQSPDIIYIYDLKKEENIFINKDLNILLGYQSGEISEDSIEVVNELIHSDDKKQFENYDYDVLHWKDQYVKEFEYRLKDAKGNWRWFYGREKEFQREKGKITTIIGVVSEITERKIAEQELIISEDKFKSFATLLPEVVYEIDLHGNLLFVNLKAYEIFEYTPEDFAQGLNIFQMVAPEEIAKVRKEMSQITEDYKAVGNKYTAVTKTGRRFPILIYADLVKVEGIITGLRGIIVNIEDLTIAEEELRKSEEKFRLLFENTQDAIFITDNKGIVDCNMQAVNMFACSSKEELINKSSVDFSPEYQPNGKESKLLAKNYLDIAHKGEKIMFEWLHNRLDKTNFYAEVSLIPFKIDGKPYLQSIVRDITERKEIEQRIYDTIVQAEEAERQRLASDIHDDIGPLLSSLKMYIESLNISNDSEKQEFIKNKLQSLIVESISNVREVSNALSPYLLNKYGIISAVKAFISNIEEIIDVTFETNFDKERFDIKHEVVFYRVTKELINNTIKHSRADSIKIFLNLNDNKLVLIYEDNGIGINDAQLENQDKGMGLINITNRISSINGRLRYYKPKQKGFGFELISEVKLKTDKE